MRKHIKAFKSQDRFDSEWHYHAVFEDLGFNTVHRIYVDSKAKKIGYEYINGSTPEITDAETIINWLVAIYKKRRRIIPFIDDKALKGRFMEIVESSLGQLNSNPKSIQHVLNILEKRYKCSVFKDSKASNWIKTDNHVIFILDFDYVIPSFFLQDLAQYVTSLVIDSQSNININYSGWLGYYLSKTIAPLNKKMMQEYEILFLSSCLVSNIKKLNYMNNYIDCEDRIASLSSMYQSRLQMEVDAYARNS